MATVNNYPRPAYVYDADTNQWYEVGGKTDINASYEWNGMHNFLNSTAFGNSVVMQKGFNVFLNESARNEVVPTPIYGTMAFLKQDSLGNTINDLQVYDGSNWLSIVDPLFTFNQQSSSYTLSLIDSYKMIEMSGGGNLTVPPESSVNFPIGTAIDIVQTGSSQVTIVAGSGVTVNATPGLKLRTQWSSATLVKRAADTWLLMGDLVA
jgi:hypothetical protein